MVIGKVRYFKTNNNTGEYPRFVRCPTCVASANLWGKPTSRRPIFNPVNNACGAAAFIRLQARPTIINVFRLPAVG
jgi:hypothetical protein